MKRCTCDLTPVTPRNADHIRCMCGAVVLSGCYLAMTKKIRGKNKAALYEKFKKNDHRTDQHP